MRLRIISLILFVCGVTLFTGSVIKARKAKNLAPRSFVVQYLVSRSENNNALTPCEYRVRWTSSTGEWKETRYSFKDGKVSTWGGAGDGLYLISGNSRQYFGDNNLESARVAMRSAEGFKSSPTFKRTEQLLGLTTYVLKDPNPVWDIEVNYAPETGPTSLKHVIHANSGDGESFIEVKEAINIEFRDLSEDEVKLPDLPVRFDIAEQKAKDLKAAGQLERANSFLEAANKLKTMQK